MTATLRIYLALAISVLLALTGQGMAMSRGVSASVGQMVICTGTGPIVVHVDQDGQPSRPPHYCPDYAMSLLGAVGAAQAAPVLPPLPVPGQPGLLRSVWAQAPMRCAQARAPPSGI